MSDLRQSSQYSDYMQKIGWDVEKITGGQVFIKKISFLGSLIKFQRPEKIQFDQLEQLARKYHSLFIKIEPTHMDNGSWLMNRGYRLDSSPLLPTKTLQLDLTPKEEEIFSQMAKDCRYEIRKAEKNNLRVNASSQISDFISLWQQNALRRGFWLPLKKEIQAIYESFGKNAYLLLATREGTKEILAGALIVIHNQVASYFHAASSPEGRQLSAPYFVVWEAIKLAKEKGCRIFDFEGIYDERFPNKSWLGFTHFKKSFGGREIEYPGCFIKFYNPIFKLSSSIVHSMSKLRR